MSLKVSDLSVLAYSNNFTLWHYTTVDDTAAIDTAGYFNTAVDMLRINDLLIINTDTDGTPSTKFHIVTSNNGIVVGVTVYSQ